MALFEGKTPAERNKLIAAIALPVVALAFIVYSFSGPSKPSGASTNRNANSNRQQRAGNQPRANQPNSPDSTDTADFNPDLLTPVNCCAEFAGGADAGRNIFAFYEKPVPAPSVPSTPTPTPTPPPPWTLASLAPQSVFARTASFTMQVNGDKFAVGARVVIDGQPVQTQYKSMQQLTATVPASLIANPGARSVSVRSPDGKLYSNDAQLNVMQPPAPTYIYVGLLRRPRSNSAILKDQRGELYTVREGDIIEGRFRVASISEQGIEVVDKDLNIKHTLTFTAAPGSNNQMQGRVPGSIQPPPSEEEP